MKIGVVSDSHDHVKPLQKVIEAFVRAKVEAIFHAGDFIAPFSAKLLVSPYVPENIPVYCVYGNNDGERAGLKNILPGVQDGPIRVMLGCESIIMQHSTDDLSDKDLDGADVIITGHTHELCHELRDGVLHLNPGECCGVLTGKSTAVILDTEDQSVEVLEL